MLTNQDLQKIGNLIDTKLVIGFKDFEIKLDQKFEEKLSPIKHDLNILKTDVAILKTDVFVLKSDVKKIRKDQKTITNYFDKELLQQRFRLDKLESKPILRVSST